MTVYPIALFLHIVAALGIFAALALEWAALYNLRRAESAGQLREWAKLLAVLRRLGGPSALTLLVTGIYLGLTRWGEQAWIGLGLLGLVVMAVLGAILTGRRLGQTMKESRAERETLSPGFRRRLNDPVLLVSAWFRTGLGLAIIFLMSAKPQPVGAIITVSAGVLLGLAAGLVATRSRESVPMTPHSAES